MVIQNLVLRTVARQRAISNLSPQARRGGRTNLSSRARRGGRNPMGWIEPARHHTPPAGLPGFIAGHSGVGLSQRTPRFVTRAEDGPHNVVEPGKKPRVTPTPTLA